jgi:hypothetical protein
VVLANCKGGITDDEGVALCLLNNPDIDTDTKKKYIQLLSTRFTEINKIIKRELWTSILDKGILEFSAANFTHYFQNIDTDSSLINYVNNATSSIDFTNIGKEFGDDVAGDLFTTILFSADIDTDKYKNILVDLGYVFDSYAEEIKIPDDKFAVLIVEKLLIMDDTALAFVREKYKSHLMPYIRENLDKYVEIQTSDIFSLKEALDIITWDIPDSKKIILLEFAEGESISIVGKSYTDAVNSHILEFNLDAEDKPQLYKAYSQFGNSTKVQIAKLAIDDADNIVAKQMRVDSVLLSLMFQSDDLAAEQKIQLFINAIPMASDEAYCTHLDELGLAELSGIFAKSGGRRNYEKSVRVKHILDALKHHGVIYAYREDERNSEKYIVTKNKPRNKILQLLDLSNPS